MDNLDETKIDEKKENCFSSTYDITLNKIEKLDNKFRNINLKDINNKIIMQSITISKDDNNSLNIEMRTPKFLQILVSLIFSSMPCMIIFYYTHEKYNLSFIFLLLSILILAILFYLLLEKVNFGLKKAIFEDNKIHLSYENRKNEIIINSNTRFIIESKYYQKQIWQISLSDSGLENIIVFLFNVEELYAANYLAYKMNKYVLNKLQKN